jgi:hypothetical protein
MSKERLGHIVATVYKREKATHSMRTKHPSILKRSQRRQSNGMALLLAQEPVLGDTSNVRKSRGRRTHDNITCSEGTAAISRSVDTGDPDFIGGFVRQTLCVREHEA